MAYNAYSGSVYAMLPEIKAQLEAADPTHARFEFQDVGTDINKICFKYKPENKFIMIFATYNSYSSAYYYNLQIQIGSAYDSATKTISGNLEKYGGLVNSTSVNTQEALYFANRTYSHQLFIDRDGIFWNFYNTITGENNNGWMLQIEFLPIAKKEYDDASSGIFVNFFSYPTAHSVNLGYYNAGQYFVCKDTYKLIDESKMLYAFKSLGNNKIYFEFPRIHNNPGTWSNPIYQSKRWFLVSKTGLAVNDVISWLDSDNVTVHKFIVCEVGGAKSGTIPTYYIAIPYDNPVMYS